MIRTNGTERILSPKEVEDLIAEGHAIVILNDEVLKLDSWLRYHPGGDKTILHMVGKDATDEVNAYVTQNRVNFDF
jgi:delta8-fatty-acid desaturase